MANQQYKRVRFTFKCVVDNEFLAMFSISSHHHALLVKEKLAHLDITFETKNQMINSLAIYIQTNKTEFPNVEVASVDEYTKIHAIYHETLH